MPHPSSNFCPTLSPRLDLPRFWPSTETKSLAIADLIWMSWSPWRGFCGRWEVLGDSITLRYMSILWSISFCLQAHNSFDFMQIIHSFWIFYSTSSKSTTAQRRSHQLQHWYCVRVNTPKRYRQLWVKDLPKVPTWWLEWDSNLQHSGRKAPNLPLSHHAPLIHA